MEQVLQQIEAYKSEIENLQLTDAKILEEYRIKFLGTKGIVKALMGEMKNVSAEIKKSSAKYSMTLNYLLKINTMPQRLYHPTTDMPYPILI
jgi:Aminoacyl tRNA synthetase class II, N-terminal domain